MMKQVLLILTSVLFFVSCKQTEKNGAEGAKNFVTNMAGGDVTIKGTIDGLKDDNDLVINYSNGEGNFKTDTVKPVNGSFSYAAKLTEPTFYIIGEVNNNEKQPLMFFADPGTISIKGNIDSLHKATVNGGASQKEYAAIWGHLMAMYTKDEVLYEAFKAANESKDVAAVKRIQDEHDSISKASHHYIISYARNNPNSIIAAYLLKRSIGSEQMEKSDVFLEASRVFDSLDAPVKSSFFGKEIKLAFDSKKSTTVGAILTDFTQNDENEKPIALSSFRGKYVLVDFWASWCGPCRAENPNVVKAYAKYHAKGLEILGVSLDENKAKWLEAIKKDNLTWTHVSDLKGWRNAVAVQYGIQSIPASFLLDKEGKIIGRDLRGEALEAALQGLMP